MDTARAKTLLATAASIAASAVLVRTVVNDLLPDSFLDYVLSAASAFFSRFATHVTVVIDEYRDFSANLLYRDVEAYLGTKISPATRRIRVSREEDGDRTLDVTIDRGEEVADDFDGVFCTWVLVSREKNHVPLSHHRSNATIEARHYELSFHRRHREVVMRSYLPFVVERAKAIRMEEKGLKIHTGKYDDVYSGNMDVWTAVALDHPATFGTLAMEPAVKRAVVEDLDRFVKRKEYYRKVGKAWKRGYLLYGPPGTGKSSLIAAMANHLNFNIYDLELSQIKNNSDLRTMLMATDNRSMLIVEDVDCAISLKNRESEDKKADSNGSGADENRGEKVTLSGLLNLIDGLWSSCGDERIIVFTTNYKDRLDPALLRPGRMDMHIYMSYCTPSAFRVLALNYHSAKDHPLFVEVDQLVTEVEVTPAEVAEELLRSDDIESALNGLIRYLKVKKLEKVEANVERNGEEKKRTGGSS